MKGFNGGVLVERGGDLAALTALVDAACAGSGRLVFLGGEAGVGKTALAAALAEVATARMTVRRGRCDNVTTAAPLGPVLEAIPELADATEGSATGEGVSRLRLFRRVGSLLSAEPTLLLIEDVHWADEATLDLLRYLGRRLGGRPLLGLATFRADEVTGDHPLTVVLGDLVGSPDVTRHGLTPLSVAGVGELIAASGLPADADELHGRTGGNPFYVTEVLAAGEQHLPATVRDAILARASRLSRPAHQVLAAAAVLGQPAAFGLLVAVSGQPAAAVDECVQHGLLVADEDAWMFRHELARIAVEQSLSPATAVTLHAAALQALRAAGRADDRRLAHHAASCGDHPAAIAHANRAAARATRLGAHRSAAAQYRLALRFEDRPDERARLLAALSYECYLTDQLDEAYATRREALELSESSGDAVAVGRAQRWLSRLSWYLGRNDEGERYAGQAVRTLEPLGDGPELAMAYSNLAQLRMNAGDAPATIDWGNRAIELARRIGDRDTEIHALNNVGTAIALAGESLEGRRRLAQSLDLALAADAHEHAARAYTNLGSVSVTIRELGDADRYLRAGIAYCSERDLDSWRLYMRVWEGRSAAEQGRYPDAREYVTEVLNHPRLSPVTRIMALVLAGELDARQGAAAPSHLDEAQTLAASTGEVQRLGPVAAARAEAAWIAGRNGDIEAEIDGAWAVAVDHPNAWDIGELAWWLTRGRRPRPLPVPVARPFALMLDGQWRLAAEAWHVLRCPLWAAYALAAAPDLDAAREALEIVDRIGATAVRSAILRDRQARGLPSPRGPQATSRANPSGLTVREIEVLRLLVEGLSNAEIAGQLFLSQKTVSHHVSSVLRKLDEPSRSRAVASALRRGIVTPA